METRKKRIKFGLITQVAILFLVGSTIIGLLTYFTQYRSSTENVITQTESLAERISKEVEMAIKEYPAYPWLLRYWYDHPDTLDISYDEKFWDNSVTEEKCHIFSERHPDMSLRYIEGNDIETLSYDDRKLYAEIAYSWMITRINEIKQAFDVDFLFCVLTDEPYDEQFFLFSAADPDSVRGTNYLEVYPLGVISEVNESQQFAMQNAVEKYEYLAEAGEYMDYYTYFSDVDGHKVLIGLTFSVADLKQTTLSQAQGQTILAVIFQGILSLVSLFSIYHFVIIPLKKVQHNMRYYKETKDSVVVRKNLAKIHPRNELGTLSEDFSDLTSEMDDYIDEIEAITTKTQRLGAELELAARIQSSTLPTDFPPFPERNEFDIYAIMDPAKEVGGDFYDFFFLDEDHLALMIADVSGKGIPASLFMMISMVLSHIASEHQTSPSKILETVNEQICASNPEEMFVSVWMGILEVSTGKMVATNAGHEYPMIKHADGRYEVLKDKHGFVIGGIETAKYQDYEIQLAPGSKIFVYTDGLPEATDKDNRMFGMDRIVDVLNQNIDSNVTDTIKNMQTAVDEFVKDAEQFDDLTMLAFSYYGKQGREQSEEASE